MNKYNLEHDAFNFNTSGKVAHLLEEGEIAVRMVVLSGRTLGATQSEVLLEQRLLFFSPVLIFERVLISSLYYLDATETSPGNAVDECITFTCAVLLPPNKSQPLTLQVTNEPPAGLKAGILRSYTVIVDQERLERVETAQWRQLLYTLCFLHSVVGPQD